MAKRLNWLPGFLAIFAFMKVIAVARNYADHAKELNNPVPTEPIIFMKPASSVVLDGEPFYIPDFSKEIHYEAEIVLHLCKNGRQVKEKFAADYYDNITLGVDFTARDLQKKQKETGLPWEIAKSFDKSAPIGEWIPKSEFPDLYNIGFSLKKNGNVVQEGNTGAMLFRFEPLIVYTSQFFTLNIHDIFFTGTPPGVGAITKGDHLEGFIENRKVFDCRIM